MHEIAVARANGPATLTPPPGWPSAIPPLPEIDRQPPPIRVALPDGRQAQLPGFLWPNPSVWNLAYRTRRDPVAPIEIRQVKRTQSNPLVAAWHDLGAERRPFAYTAFVLCVRGERSRSRPPARPSAPASSRRWD